MKKDERVRVWRASDNESANEGGDKEKPKQEKSEKLGREKSKEIVQEVLRRGKLGDERMIGGRSR